MFSHTKPWRLWRINNTKHYHRIPINVFVFIFTFIGKYIPASQRPDGTWRKARRVKEGYVPQEEVPLYESKGKQHMNRVKPDLPVGMCPIIAQQAKQKRDKREKQQAAKTAGIIHLPSISNHVPAAAPISEAKASNPPCTTNPSASSKKSNKNKSNKTKAADSTKPVCEAISNLSLATEDDLAKKLKKLRKKIREIETIEEKLNAGQLKNPEQDQLDKVSRKAQILKELQELEQFEVNE